MLRLGARSTVGAATPDAPKPDRWVPYTAFQHDTLRWLEVVQAVGARPGRFEPHLAVTAADLAESRAVLPSGDRPLVVVHPGATDPRRCYPEERLGAVARDLGEQGARVVMSTAGRREVDAVVGGGGAAGLAAAAWLARYRRQVVVVDSRDYRSKRVERSHGYLGRDPHQPLDL